MRIYMASSWKIASLVKCIAEILRLNGLEVDCFCDESTGRFSFSFDQLPAESKLMNGSEIFSLFVVLRAFQEDRKWLDWADACVLVLPSGRSAHLEAGYAVGRGKKLYIIGDLKPGEWDVMYGFAERIYSYDQLVDMMTELNALAQEIKPRPNPPLCKR